VVRDCATLSVSNPRPTISPPSNIDFFMTQPRKPFNLKNKGQGLGAPKLSFRLPALTQSILHGWPLEARTLFRVHCVVPAGGLSLDRTRWIRARDNYFLPKKVLGELFRGKFVDALKEAFQHGQLQRRTS